MHPDFTSHPRPFPLSRWRAQPPVTPLAAACQMLPGKKQLRAFANKHETFPATTSSCPRWLALHRDRPCPSASSEWGWPSLHSRHREHRTPAPGQPGPGPATVSAPGAELAAGMSSEVEAGQHVNTRTPHTGKTHGHPQCHQATIPSSPRLPTPRSCASSRCCSTLLGGQPGAPARRRWTGGHPTPQQDAETVPSPGTAKGTPQHPEDGGHSHGPALSTRGWQGPGGIAGLSQTQGSCWQCHASAVTRTRGRAGSPQLPTAGWEPGGAGAGP